MEMFNPPHPGEILLEEYIRPLELSVSSFALKIGTSRKNLSKIVNEKVGISPEMALKLAKALGTSPEIWLRLQLKYDLWQAKQRTNFDYIEAICPKKEIA
ncbi:MAG: HigA family addiction module antitoxin [bacterium]